VISIAVVLTAVFVPTALVSGISGQFGTNYVNDFNFPGRTYQVNLQGDAAFRSDPNQYIK
jgi:multidrug efflux pump subunit AcrB